ncbi:unnamed protein product [Lactuca virosa]|uniref:Uncharacterized protein n=1 Tax=Lactuca virosa TaxID=75947 RepID=A0AAU9P7U2_9ASTR|nr:unnamed protein product [Lactuca virosa]
MRVSPLNHYQLVDIKPDPDLQLASTKSHLVHGCTSFICFGRAATGPESSPSHLKLDPSLHPQPQPQPQPQDDLKHSPESEKVTKTCTTDLDLDNFENKNGDALKSSLKRPKTSVIASVDVNGGECKNECGDTETRKVQWTDVFGGELFEIREFEPSEHDGSDDESNWNEGTCTCMIM